MQQQLSKVSSKAIFDNTIRIKAAKAILLLLVCLQPFMAKAQLGYDVYKHNLGITVTTSLTGSGFGSMQSPMVHYGYKNQLFLAGALVQKGEWKGIKASYQYTLYGQEQRSFVSHRGCNTFFNPNLDFFAFASVRYENNVTLSKTWMTIEGTDNAENQPDLKSIRFNAYEVNTGFGMRARLFEGFKIFGNVGVGYYCSKVTSGYDEKKLYHNKNSCMVTLSAGITYTIFKRSKGELPKYYVQNEDAFDDETVLNEEENEDTPRYVE
jgi:hypothetical protein